MNRRQDTIRPPFSLRIQIVDADGKLIQSLPGPTVDLHELETLRVFGRAVEHSYEMVDLLRRLRAVITKEERISSGGAVRLLGEIGTILNRIEGKRP